MFRFGCAQVSALKTMAVQGGPTYSLAQQPWAQPGKLCLRKTSCSNSSKPTQQMLEVMPMFFSVFFFSVYSIFSPFSPLFFSARINDIVMATYRVMKSKLPSTLQSMSLYLANRDTEFILFKPVRVGGRKSIRSTFTRWLDFILSHYNSFKKLFATLLPV